MHQKIPFTFAIGNQSGTGLEKHLSTLVLTNIILKQIDYGKGNKQLR